MDDEEIRILDRFTTQAGFIFTVRDGNQYSVGQTVRYHGSYYTIIGININRSLNVIGWNVVRKS